MTRTLPWTRLFAEGVVVVASILLALAVDAWWSDRTAEVTRQEWLASLRADFATNASEALSYAERSAEDRALVQRFVLMSEAEAASLPEDSVWLYLNAIWRPNPAPLNTPAIVAALEAAPVLAADDDALRRVIGTWRTEISYLAQFDVRLWETQDRAFSSIVSYPEIQRVVAMEPDAYWDNPVRTVPRRVLLQARTDDEVMRLAAQKTRYAAQQIRFLRTVANAAENVRDAAAAAMVR